MHWSIEFEDSANSDLTKLDHAVRRRVVSKIEWLAEHFEKVKIRQLQADWHGFFKLRAGIWRVAYTFSELKKIITVWHIDNRDKIYKRK